MTQTIDSIKDLQSKAAKFRDERNWKQFHNPKDLAISLSLEASELLEIFQWSGSNTEVDTEHKLDKVKEELADVLIYSFLMADGLNLNITEIVNDKLQKNNQKYPADKCANRADKYTAYLE